MRLNKNGTAFAVDFPGLIQTYEVLQRKLGEYRCLNDEIEALRQESDISREVP